MHNSHCFHRICLIFLSIAPFFLLQAQEKEYIAIIPTFHDRLNSSGTENFVQLQHQQFVLFVYRNAVVVYSKADFVNTGMNMVSQEFALPSTGHDENGTLPGGRISNGILSVQLWIQGERIAPDFINDGTEDWNVIRTQFSPGEQRKVETLFWAQTSLADVDSMPGLDTIIVSDGKRGFMVDLAHAAIWNSPIETISINVVLMQGIDVKQGDFSADPNTYEVQDSTLTWKLSNVEPSANDNIFVWYSGIGKHGQEYNTMAKLSTYIVKTVYRNLLYYAREMDEK